VALEESQCMGKHLKCKHLLPIGRLDFNSLVKILGDVHMDVG